MYSLYPRWVGTVRFSGAWRAGRFGHDNFGEHFGTECRFKRQLGSQFVTLDFVYNCLGWLATASEWTASWLNLLTWVMTKSVGKKELSASTASLDANIISVKFVVRLEDSRMALLTSFINYTTLATPFIAQLPVEQDPDCGSNDEHTLSFRNRLTSSVIAAYVWGSIERETNQYT